MATRATITQGSFNTTAIVVVETTEGVGDIEVVVGVGKLGNELQWRPGRSRLWDVLYVGFT